MSATLKRNDMPSITEASSSMAGSTLERRNRKNTTSNTHTPSQESLKNEHHPAAKPPAALQKPPRRPIHRCNQNCPRLQDERDTGFNQTCSVWCVRGDLRADIVCCSGDRRPHGIRNQQTKANHSRCQNNPINGHCTALFIFEVKNSFEKFHVGTSSICSYSRAVSGAISGALAASSNGKKSVRLWWDWGKLQVNYWYIRKYP